MSKNLTRSQKLFIDAYLEALVWTNEEEIGDATLSVSLRNKSTLDCLRFMADHEDLLTEISSVQAGHDFWLTRNRHGTGFWDRGLGALGETLTEAAHEAGEVYLYISRKKVYC